MESEQPASSTSQPSGSTAQPATVESVLAQRASASEPSSPAASGQAASTDTRPMHSQGNVSASELVEQLSKR